MASNFIANSIVMWDVKYTGEALWVPEDYCSSVVPNPTVPGIERVETRSNGSRAALELTRYNSLSHFGASRPID